MLQAFLLVLSSFELAPRDLPLCIFTQTFLFVAGNKVRSPPPKSESGVMGRYSDMRLSRSLAPPRQVCTAQYFIWWLPLASLVLPWVRNRSALLRAAALWLVALLHWLFWAHRLEILGRSHLVPLWCASVMFYAANCVLLALVLRGHDRGRYDVIHEAADQGMDPGRKRSSTDPALRATPRADAR